jgi:demethylmenaquinone methyltransferase/2-methoxy-6-polyprenyl-1,4-benzoquinol methylase
MTTTTESRDRFIKNIFTLVAPWLDRLSRGFSFGLDRHWRRQAVARSGIPSGARVLDICCGTGELAFLLASAVGDRGTVTGTDFAFGMRNIPDTILALREIRRVLRPGGIFLCLELTQPRNRWFLSLYNWYLFRVMPFVSRLVLKSATPYLYLPRSIEAFYQPPEFRDVIRDNGFGGVSVDSLTMGIATIYRACKSD